MIRTQTYRFRCNAVLLIALLQLSQNLIEIDANMQFNQQSVEDEYLVNEPQQEKIEQMDNDGKLTVRLPSNSLLKYTSYKDVSILHFEVPPDSRAAYFSFKAFEESKSTFQSKCKVKDVTLHLKANSFPVINPENITFPKNFLNSDQRFKIYNLQFQSNEQQQRIDIQGPQTGSWFAVAFISWTDPNNDRIEQQGLAASCDTLLLAELSVSRFYPIIINDGQVDNGNLTSFLVPSQQQESNNANRSGKSHYMTAVNMSPDEDPGLSFEDSLPLQQPMQQDAELQQLYAASYEDAGVVQNYTHSHAHSQRHTHSSSSRMGSRPESDNHRDRDRDRDNNGNTKSTTNNEIIYKFYVPDDIGVATARISFVEVCMQCPGVSFQIQANAFPPSFNGGLGPGLNGNEHNYIHRTVISPNQTEEISIEFYVQPSTWHYAILRFVSATDEFWPSLVPASMSGLGLNKVTAGDAVTASKRYEARPPQPQPKWRQQNRTETEGTEVHSVSYLLQIDFQQLEPQVDASSKTQSQLVNYSDAENAWRPNRFRGMDFYSLLRQSYREFFMFDFDLQPDANGTVPALLNLTAQSAAGFAFELGDVYDIGGTLTFAVSMKHELRFSNDLKAPPSTTLPPSERGGILAEKLVSDLDESTLILTHDQLHRVNQSMQIIVCMHLGEPGVPTWPDKCRYGQRLMHASSIINSTDLMGLIHVPFPESGLWYVTMGLYCHGAETARVTIIDSVKEFVRQHASLLRDMRAPCSCAGNARAYERCVRSSDCLARMNETETLKVKECMMDSKCTPDFVEMTRLFEIHHKAATEQHFALDNCNTSVVFSISSSPCVAGRCGRFGRCYHYMSGGFVFSTCVCMKGYRGWDCTEDSQVPSSISILVALLLLTLSNLLFIPSIYMAFRRRYYTEGIIYFFAMFFSIFYHACDSGEDEYSFCLVKIGVLQFCDFYCGLLAIWVTLIAMAHLPQHFVSLLHMFGAILLAFGTELNKQSLWVFLAPALTGICLISTSWGLRCVKTRKWFPARRYLIIFMPFGMVLVMVGLVCYAFLQTKQNYHIVHSIWHMVMALSIMCLLPSRKSFMPKC
ncbi:uncharacterized protein LOC117573659 [Drosophila albomicans]|uniref:Uncharacterized protein LOC117573659 n=1 Tax=Drosophila albomicans TaxID=7291 RepID=A0A6P8X9M0_DROAB|nr:uncharacterized protein LOC117573659 [Drosophila albomicans]XP_051863774.1 uncharacterized protein LOC117573659 [Drosophila albomicans]XP_051863775.1 uncharacterized protein LOC117573659 [Drosophila albomicans]